MPLTRHDPDVFEQKHGGGCASLFGVPFALAGIAVIVASILVSLGKIEGELPWYIGIPFGSIFTAVGGSLIFYRSGLAIDRNSGEITTWWGFLKPMKVTAYRIADAAKVSITREVRRSKNSTYTVFPVRIELSNSQDTIKIAELQNEGKARASAEEIAKFIRVDLSDRASGEEIIRAHDELDLNIKQRFEKGSVTNEIPDVPGKLRSKIDFSGSALTVSIPPGGIKPIVVLPVLALLGFAALPTFAMLIPFLRKADADPVFSILFIGFISLFTLIPTSIAIRIIITALKTKEELVVTAEGIDYRKGWIKMKRTRIPATELEELRRTNISRNSNRKAIMARSDSQSLSIGEHLEQEESDYILSLMKAVLVS